MPTHKVTFLPADVTVDVDPSLYPYHRLGKPGSLLDIALANGVGIRHACDGMGACGSCHVLIEQGMENLSESEDEEVDVINRLPNSDLSSRLACQAVVHGDVRVRIP